MKKTLKLLAVLLACSLAFSCGEKEIEPVDPPKDEQTPTDPEKPEDPETPTDPETPPTEVDLFEISTAADLVKLATWVNGGTNVKTAMLKNDIDMASVTEWTPIGNAICPAGAVDAAISGNAWTGVFDGNGFKIKNLKMVASGKTAGANYGLFGVLAPGSLVQNFIIDATCSLEVTATASIATGIVAGYVYDGTVRDVTNHAPMTFKGKAGSAFMSMAMIGQLYCNENGITIDSCHNNGDIKAENTDNLEAGAKAYHIAGIVGFAHALADSKAISTISDCSNAGNITSATGRSAGIVGAMNRNCQLVSCENTGNQINTMPKEEGGRLGNITCNITDGCKMTGCINRGNLVSTTKARCGGITSLSNAAEFENCANYGEVLTDSQYRGLFWGYNTKEATWKNCIASGKVGTYAGGTPVYDEYTESGKAQYLGVQKSGTASNLIDITYLIGVKEPEHSDVQADLSILFIGNSFTMDAVTHLPGMLKAAGLDNVHMVHMYYGGRLISQYYSGWTTSSDYKMYECLPGATSWTTTSNKNLSEIAASKKWDIVTIQEHTGNAAAWTWNATAQSNIQGLIDKVKATQGDNVPKFHYILSQAYFNMDKIGSGSKPSITWSDQAGMWDVISAFGKNVMDNCTFDGVISTGVMLQNLRTSGIDNEMNLTRDGYHMDNGIARYGASCTVFESIITPKFNVNLDGNSYRFSTSNTTDGSYTTPVTDENAPIALQAARAAIENPYVVTDMSGVGPDGPDTPVEEIDLYEISTAADLVDFAALVNGGTIVKKAVLKNNIDMASVTSWTPIGNGTFSGSVSSGNQHTSSYSGAAFKGEFDGQGYSIRNFKMVADLTSSQTVYGLFGILDNAKVSNVTIGAESGDASELTFHAANGADVGVIAGAVLSSTIENCVNYAPMHAKGTGVDNVRATMGAFGGFVYADQTNGGSVLKNLTNYGSIKVEGDKNTKNGATSVMGAGIAGITNGTTNITSARNLVYNCVNHGDMVSSVPRTSGIIAAINQYTDVELCKNYGDQTNSNSSTRVGMISAIMTNYTTLKDCENYGDAVMTGGSSAQVGGLICLLNSASATISGGGNYGKIVGDIAATSYKGTIVANFSNLKSVSGVVAGGGVGSYNGGNYQMETITADNYMQFIGKIKAEHADKITDITFKAMDN